MRHTSVRGTRASTALRVVTAVVTPRIVGAAQIASMNLSTHQFAEPHRLYWLPLYRMRLKVSDGATPFWCDVVRFGVAFDLDRPTRDYLAGKRVASDGTCEWDDYPGWRLSKYKQVLIHEGPARPEKRPYGALGCIEVTKGKWRAFKRTIAELCGYPYAGEAALVDSLRRIGEAGQFCCRMSAVRRPRMIPVDKTRGVPSPEDFLSAETLTPAR